MYNIGIFLICVVIYTSSALETVTPEKACKEELNLLQPSMPNLDVARNRSCLQKCVYQKEGKLDKRGNFIVSKFGDIPNIDKCVNTVKETTDVCSKVTDMIACIKFIKSSKYAKYGDCTKKLVPSGLPADKNFKAFNCYERCVMIKDGKIDEKGRVKFDYFKKTYINITREEAVDFCNQLVYDVNLCTRNVTMFDCVNYILGVRSTESTRREMACAKETKTYPFIQTMRPTTTPRACYKRCTFIKSGKIDENGKFTNNNFTTQNNIKPEELRDAIKTCELHATKTDKCNKDVYMYDCVLHVLFASPETLQMNKDCAKETKTSLVKYIDSKYNLRSCFSRCLMIKNHKLNPKGAVNKRKLQKLSTNSSMIDISIATCRKQVTSTKDKCQKDMDTYDCVKANIAYEIQKFCDAEMQRKHSQSSTVVYNACANVCRLTLSGTLSPSSEVKSSAFLGIYSNVTTIEAIIKYCTATITHEESCVRNANIYLCSMNNIILYSAGISTIKNFL